MLFRLLHRRFVTYLQSFIQDSRAIGIMLVSCTALALLMANSGVGPGLLQLLHHEIELLHKMNLPHTPMEVINDALMALFFFLVGMEIKRELVAGELASFKRAILPVGAAIGGMLVPATIFMLFNKGGSFQNGWGIPMATDIAFSLGVASMFGKKFPVNLKIFLTALAIIDDLGAILVIAFFYGGSVNGVFLFAALCCIAAIWGLGKMKVKFGWPQMLLGLSFWYFTFNSGIHSTIAGVVFAFMVPVEKLNWLEHKLHNVVNFGILPVFAFANTAILLPTGVLYQLTGTLGFGIMAGLVVGKPIGIFGACWLLVKNKVAELPHNIAWSQIFGAGILAGIGFTMSIFIAGLAFAEAGIQDISKIAIVIAALISLIASVVWFNLVKPGENSIRL